MLGILRAGAAASSGAMASIWALTEQLQKMRELRRLAMLPRKVPASTNLFGPALRLVDGASFTAQYDSLFRKEECRFTARDANPVIVDCGANVGVSCLYWKSLYPHAKVTAFEPDPRVFAALSSNMRSFGYEADVTTIEAAVWTEKGTLEFWSEGADGGRLSSLADSRDDVLQVRSVRLRDYLDGHVDMLKIDIEGAEVDVMLDVRDALDRVDNVCVEYHSFAGKPQRLHELLAILTDGGFRIQIRSEQFAEHPFITVPESGMDLQLQVFGFRADPISLGRRPAASSS